MCVAFALTCLVLFTAKDALLALRLPLRYYCTVLMVLVFLLCIAFAFTCLVLFMDGFPSLLFTEEFPQWQATGLLSCVQRYYPTCKGLLRAISGTQCRLSST